MAPAAGAPAAPLALLLLAALAAPQESSAVGIGDAAAEAADPNGPIRGEYGFLSQFSGITVQEARERVRTMHRLFGVLEFELRDAFERYSKPPSLTAGEWGTPIGGGRVSRDIVEAITSEVRSLGGRSWLVVNAMATDPDDWTLQDDAVVAGRFSVGEKALMDVIVPDGKWAGTFVPAWAEWAKSVGCSGIHWSSMGDYNGSSGKGADFSGFLLASYQIVKDKGLGQIANFADGFGWNASLVQRRVVAFPYWVVFTVPKQEDRFFDETPMGSVLVMYPGESADHGEEPWNRFVRGVSPLDVLILRWQRARCHGDSYLAVGDGSKRVTSDYTPMASEMSSDEIAKVRKKVFGRYTCEDGNVMHAADLKPEKRRNASEGIEKPAADLEAKTKQNVTEAAESGVDVRFLDKKASHGQEAKSERHTQARQASDAVESDTPAQGASLGARTRQALRGQPPSGFWLGVPLLVGAFAASAGTYLSRSRGPTSARAALPVAAPPSAAGGSPAPEAATGWAYQMSARPCRPHGDVDY